jgi:hypothetical protein
VVYCIGWAMPATSKKAPTVKAGWGHALGRQHDIGMGVYHFAANALLPLIWLAAGNKAEFASGTVKLPTGRMAVALVPWVGLNLQLDCNEWCALPTSVCIASLNTVRAGFSLGDCLGGFAAMLSDIGLTFLVSKVAGWLNKAVGKGVEGLLGMIGNGVTPLLVVGLATIAFPTATVAIQDSSKMVIGWMLGSPVGYSFSFGPGSVYGGKLNDVANDRISGAVDRFFSSP